MLGLNARLDHVLPNVFCAPVTTMNAAEVAKPIEKARFIE